MLLLLQVSKMSEADKKTLVTKILDYMESLHRAIAGSDSPYKDIRRIVIFADEGREDSFDPMIKDKLFETQYGYWRYVPASRTDLMSRTEEYLKEAAGMLEEAIARLNEKYWPTQYYSQIEKRKEERAKK